MSKIKITRRVNAPLEMVFRTISDIRNFSKAVPDIVDVEFTSGVQSGVGTKFRETREFSGKKMATELEITEYEEDSHVRIISDTQGTVWDSLFTVSDLEGATELELEMEARPYKFSARLTNLFLKRFIKKALAKDMNAVKKYCERRAL